MMKSTALSTPFLQQHSSDSGMLRRSKRKAAAAALDAMAGIKRTATALTMTSVTGLSTVKKDGQVELHGITIPADSVAAILQFLTKPELTHKVSLVCSSWRAASHNPVLWDAIEESDWKDPNKKNGQTTEIDFLLDVLRRPQFSRLKELNCPDFLSRPRSPTVWDRIAAACPHLEGIHTKELKPNNDKEMLRLSQIFPKLKNLALILGPENKNSVTAFGIAQFAQHRGETLRHLSVVVYCKKSLFTDSTLDCLSISCPNLISFCYAEFYNSNPICITGRGFLGLVESCTNLGLLNLCFFPRNEANLNVIAKVDKFLDENRNGVKTERPCEVGYSWVWDKIDE